MNTVSVNPFMGLSDPDQYLKEAKHAAEKTGTSRKVHRFAEAEERIRQEERAAEKAARKALRDAARSERLDRPSVKPVKPTAKRSGKAQRGKLKTKENRTLSGA